MKNCKTHTHAHTHTETCVWGEKGRDIYDGRGSIKLVNDRVRGGE